MAAKVRIFRSTDVGALTLSGTIGTLIPILDACLVNGLPTQSVTGITLVGTTATATAAGHGYRNGDTVTIAGAVQTAYNGVVTILNVTLNTFDFVVAGSPASPATGTITVAKTAAGWTKAFSGTNLAAYRQASGPLQYLAVDDTTAQYASVRGYEAMTAVTTGTAPYPTATQAAISCWQKSTTASATAIPWAIYATDSLIMIWMGVVGTTATCVLYVFGQFISYKPGDVYNNIITSSTSATVNYSNLNVWTALQSSVANNGTNLWLDRTYTQLGASVLAGVHSDTVKLRGGVNSNGSAVGIMYPNGPDNGLYVAPVWVHEALTTPILRGIVPGMWAILHSQVLTHGDTWSGTGDLSGKTFEVVDFTNTSNARCSWAIETSDTWGI